MLQMVGTCMQPALPQVYMASGACETHPDKHVRQGRLGLTQLRHRSQCYQKHALLSRALHVILQQQPSERAQRAELCSSSKSAVQETCHAHTRSVPTKHYLKPGILARQLYQGPQARIVFGPKSGLFQSDMFRSRLPTGEGV